MSHSAPTPTSSPTADGLADLGQVVAKETMTEKIAAAVKAAHGMYTDIPSDSLWAGAAEFEKKLAKFELAGKHGSRKRPAEDEVEKITKVVDELPKELQFSEEKDDKLKSLYEDYLWCDEDKKFPLAAVYGGDQAYRGKDRPSFKVNTKNFQPMKAHHMGIQIRDGPANMDIPSKLFGCPTHKNTEWEAIKAARLGKETEKKAKASAAKAAKEEAAKKAKKTDGDGDEEMEIVEIVPDVPDDADDDELDFDEGYGATDPTWLSVKYFCDTQRPGVQIELDMQNGGEAVTCTIYANSLQRSADTIGIDFCGATDPIRCQNAALPKDHPTQELKAAHELLRVDLDLYAPGVFPQRGARGRPVWNNVTKEEVNKWRAEFKQAMSPEGHSLSDQQLLIVLLHDYSEFTLFGKDYATAGEKREAFDKFKEFFCVSMYACAHLGNFWWYGKSTVDKDDKSELYHYLPITSEKFPFEKVPVPRWLVRKWQVTYNAEDMKPLTAVMVECNAYANHSASPLPDDSTSSFQYRLACARDGAKIDAELKDMGKNSTPFLHRALGGPTPSMKSVKKRKVQKKNPPAKKSKTGLGNKYARKGKSGK